MAEIRISDLSIGDWVKFESNGRYMPMMVFEISSYRKEIVGETTFGRLSFKEEEISPIPLTPEILEKNGLCVVEEDADFSEYELFGSENFSIFHTKGTLHYRLETSQASVVCWNVHQLQHALRLASVEKEIVL